MSIDLTSVTVGNVMSFMCVIVVILFYAPDSLHQTANLSFLREKILILIIIIVCFQIFLGSMCTLTPLGIGWCSTWRRGSPITAKSPWRS